MTPSLPARARGIFLLGPERLELREIDLPRPAVGEILVAIEAATTCGTDLKVFRRGGHPRMLEVPGPFGHEMTGVVVAVGDPGDLAGGGGPPPFAVGDAVVIANSVACGNCTACSAGRENLCPDLRYLNGAFADYLLVPAAFVARSTYSRPPGLAPELAALAEPLACVEHGLERLGLRPRSTPLASPIPSRSPRPPGEVLVLGAGPLGLLFCAALAEEGQAVTLADPHLPRLEAGLRLGARDVLHLERSGNEAPPVARVFPTAIDATGTVGGWSTAVAATAPGGTTLFFGGCAPADRVELPTYPVHYDELSLLGCYHHTPRSFRAAIDRLAAARSDYRTLLSAEMRLPEVARALAAMRDREALKVVIRPA